jgi:hypothetical protein
MEQMFVIHVSSIRGFGLFVNLFERSWTRAHWAWWRPFRPCRTRACWPKSTGRTASDGQTWGGDANSQSAFSIANNTGQVSNGNGTYTLRFRAVGTTLYARAWRTGTSEPTGWMITVTDSAFPSGFCGLRMQVASGVTASYTSFLATAQ